MNNPFDYEPSAEMLRAQTQLIAHIESLCKSNSAFAEEVAKGKMFGIMLVSAPASVFCPSAKDPRAEESGADIIHGGRCLWAFSGQICGSFDWPGFVPAVFDYLDEDGYFKIHEREISAINHKIDELENSEELRKLKEQYSSLRNESETDIEHYRQLMKAAKLERDLIRGKGVTDDLKLIHESQFMRAEFHRKKLFWKEKIEQKSAKIDGFIGEIRLLKLQRQQKSDALQRWLFEQFVFSNSKDKSEKRNLLEIFETYNRENNLLGTRRESNIPPSGAGECCEPKLLHFAVENGLEPLEMGMFWWGESPKQEVRHHLQFYPACNGKCRPILESLLLMDETREAESQSKTVKKVFSDDYIIVVDKPSGMLSVPGRSEKPSVFSILKAENPDCKELQMVHRLDMDTSGLLVVAKTKSVHKDLQRQFANHTIRKEYLAVLSRPLDKRNGIISLPLRPDYNDRPRQIVDIENGKEAVTEFITSDETRTVRLFPQTGRTHQLRVHCAHKDGLDNPIKGDRLYGQKADRLYLHAATLEFTHPVTGERMKFESPWTEV